jgi:hypothetical protein
MIVNDDEQTRTNVHALRWIRTHDLSVQAMKAYASDGAAIGTGCEHVQMRGYGRIAGVRQTSLTACDICFVFLFVSLSLI